MNTVQWGLKSEVAHKWVHWLNTRYLLGGRGGQTFRAGDKGTSSPQECGLAT